MPIHQKPDVIIVGGGLAGSEAAWQIASRGFSLRLYEMRPKVMTPAHQTSALAELVCSNSFRSAELKNAVGLLKEEMRILDSLIISAAEQNAVPGGSALVMDREGFSRTVTETLECHPRVEILCEEIQELPTHSPMLIATGPLTSKRLAEQIGKLTQSEYLYFYDSIAPIISADSIDQRIVFRASRYGKGSEDYLNCPMSKKEYHEFVNDLVAAEKVPTKDFDQPKFFEGCLPIEVMAERGPKVLAFGPMKPVGLTDPRTGERPYAVVQLRQDNLHGTLYNMVGFQTRMKHPEQIRIFRKIPGLAQAEFVRLGSMHRNTFINSPRLLNSRLEMKNRPGTFLAGQMIGVEGYVESAAMGLFAGLAIVQALEGKRLNPPGPQTALGALIRHITQAPSKDFQPMNVNYGLFEIPPALQKKDRRMDLVQSALEEIKIFKEKMDFPGEQPQANQNGSLVHAG